MGNTMKIYTHVYYGNVTCWIREMKNNEKNAVAEKKEQKCVTVDDVCIFCLENN